MRDTCRDRRLKMMPLVDEYSRECLTIEVERSITAEDVVEILASLFRQRSTPAFILSDRAGSGSSPEPSGGGWRPPG
jgi:putative transposase